MNTHTATKPAGPEIDWQAALIEAYQAPGALGSTYTRFHTYSFGNQILLMMQGLREPVASYDRWQELGRQVRCGEQAKYVRAPNTRRIEETDDTGQPKIDANGKPVKREVATGRFHWRKSAFGYSQTDGPELEFPPLPGWNVDTALTALGIDRVPFDEINGNVQGFSYEDTRGQHLAINPVAAYPMKTTFHELAHLVLGHCRHDGDGAEKHRGVKEFEAEATAYLVAKELELTTWDASESRAYIQTWLAGHEVTEDSVVAILGAVNKILVAGRSAVAAPVMAEVAA
jgi:antirestriction protein ArdC